MKINENLKKLRVLKSLTQSDMAKILDISLSSYQKYERDKNCVTPSLDVLLRIADFFGVSVDYLLGREPATDPFDMLQLPEDQKSVMERFASFPDDVRAIILDAIKELAEAAKKRQRLNTNAETTPVATAAQNGGVPKIVEMSNEKVNQLLNAEIKNNDYKNH